MEDSDGGSEPKPTCTCIDVEPLWNKLSRNADLYENRRSTLKTELKTKHYTKKVLHVVISTLIGFNRVKYIV